MVWIRFNVLFAELCDHFKSILDAFIGICCSGTDCLHICTAIVAKHIRRFIRRNCDQLTSIAPVNLSSIFPSIKKGGYYIRWHLVDPSNEGSCIPIVETHPTLPFDCDKLSTE